MLGVTILIRLRNDRWKRAKSGRNIREAVKRLEKTVTRCACQRSRLVGLPVRTDIPDNSDYSILVLRKQAIFTFPDGFYEKP